MTECNGSICRLAARAEERLSSRPSTATGVSPVHRARDVPGTDNRQMRPGATGSEVRDCSGRGVSPMGSETTRQDACLFTGETPVPRVPQLRRLHFQLHPVGHECLSANQRLSRGPRSCRCRSKGAGEGVSQGQIPLLLEVNLFLRIRCDGDEGRGVSRRFAIHPNLP